MTDEVPVVDSENLFSFALVPYVALVINASCVVPCSSVMVHPPRHQSQLNIAPSHPSGHLPEVTLDKWSEPSAVNFLGDQVSV